MSRLWNVALVGATGEVGKAIVAALEEAELPLDKLHVLASSRSADETLLFKGKRLLLDELEGFDFAQVDVAVFAVPAEVAAEAVPRALAAGCRVIDHSPVFRFDGEATLVVAGVNSHSLPNRSLIACADASTAILGPVLSAIDRRAGLSRVQLTILRAASARGAAGLGELAKQTGELLNGRGIDSKIYPQQLAFNLLPLLGAVDGQGASVDEAAIAAELRDVLGQPELAIDVSCVAVPVFYGHGTVLHVETQQYLDLAEAGTLLQAIEGLALRPAAEDHEQPSPVGVAEEGGLIHVSRLRGIASPGLGLQAWVMADNVRCGAARQSLEILGKMLGGSKKPL